MKISIFLVIFCLALSSCSTENTVKPELNSASKINFFKGTPPKKGELRAYHQALTRGYLVLQNNCLYLTDKKDSNKNLRLLFWPWNFNLKETTQGVHVINDSQKVFAKIGGFYYFGGSGSSFKESSKKLPIKYKVCITKNVIGTWGVSPEFIKRESKTRQLIKQFMKSN